MHGIWIRCGRDIGSVSPAFAKQFTPKKPIRRAAARASAMGLYKLMINGQKVGNALLTPGATSYAHRVLYQEYDVTELLADGENRVEIIGGKGWAISRFGNDGTANNFADHVSVIGEIEIEYTDGEIEIISTDESWECFSTEILDSEFYDGETVDLTAKTEFLGYAVKETNAMPCLEKQAGSFVTEQERIEIRQVLRTPKGETVLDFGQNLVGYVEIAIRGKRGEKIQLSHAEVLDKDGNFYTENMRSAKNTNVYVLSGEEDLFKPSFTFQGFRYVRLDEFPEDARDAKICAVVIHTEMERTGRFACGHALLNKLYSNIIRGQRGNYVDIPTDCPQRDERLGWTGDTQVFCRTGAINFNVEVFFEKWLRDMSLEQMENGAIARIVPFYKPELGGRISAGWSDAAAIVPWEIYRAYSNKEMLERYYPMMEKWVEYIHGFGDEEFLWIGGDHYGDWLALDAGEGVYFGATQTDLIASAYFAYSTSLVIKAGKALGRDVSYYEALLQNIKAAFRKAFMKDGLPAIYPKADALDTRRTVKADTQTACALILAFDLCKEGEKAPLAAHLADLIHRNDGLMTTGFLGTPYLLHALARNGYADVAYGLLLEERAPSWLFSVKQGATTIWEHWDSLKEDGSFWSAEMNSFNHYAYGSVFDWIFEYVGGISIDEGGEGYKKITIAPIPNKSLGFADIGIKIRGGALSVRWEYEESRIKYEIQVPEGTVADVKIPGISETIRAGKHIYYSDF